MSIKNNNDSDIEEEDAEDIEKDKYLTGQCLLTFKK